MTIIKNALVCLNHPINRQVVFSALQERCPRCGSERCVPYGKWLNKEQAA